MTVTLLHSNRELGNFCKRRGSPKAVKERRISRCRGETRDTNPFASQSVYYRSGALSDRTQDTDACDKPANRIPRGLKPARNEKNKALVRRS